MHYHRFNALWEITTIIYFARLSLLRLILCGPKIDTTICVPLVETGNVEFVNGNVHKVTEFCNDLDLPTTNALKWVN